MNNRTFVPVFAANNAAVDCLTAEDDKLFIPTEVPTETLNAWYEAVRGFVTHHGRPDNQAASDTFQLSNGETLAQWIVLSWNLPPIGGVERVGQLCFRGSDNTIHACVLRRSPEDGKLHVIMTRETGGN